MNNYLKVMLKGLKLTKSNNGNAENMVGKGNYLILRRFCQSTIKHSKMALLHVNHLV